MPLALESVLMSVLHAPVMQSLVTLHAQADAAIHKQARTHCYAGSKVWACHKDVTAYFIELESRRRQDRPLPHHAKQSSTVCRTMQNFIMLPQKKPALCLEERLSWSRLALKYWQLRAIWDLCDHGDGM